MCGDSERDRKEQDSGEKYVKQGSKQGRWKEGEKVRKMKRIEGEGEKGRRGERRNERWKGRKEEGRGAACDARRERVKLFTFHAAC